MYFYRNSRYENNISCTLLLKGYGDRYQRTRCWRSYGIIYLPYTLAEGWIGNGQSGLRLFLPYKARTCNSVPLYHDAGTNSNLFPESKRPGQDWPFPLSHSVTLIYCHNFHCNIRNISNFLYHSSSAFHSPCKLAFQFCPWLFFPFLGHTSYIFLKSFHIWNVFSQNINERNINEFSPSENFYKSENFHKSENFKKCISIYFCIYSLFVICFFLSTGKSTFHFTCWVHDDLCLQCNILGGLY